MTDWMNVALNALWIAGLAILLAAFSYHRWVAAESSSSLRSVLSRRSWKLPRSCGALLTCLGVGYGLADRWWERTLWTGLALACAFQLAADFLDARDPPVAANRPRRRDLDH